MHEPVLISATDGVGTKTAIATALERYDTIGIDLVAMCADDVVCSGAAPLFFLDYVAVGRLDPVGVAELVGGIATGCRDAGCALVGGETAEHPGIMEADQFDLAGFCVGVVERDRIIDGSAIRAGDAILGLASSGLHSNGFSLVRTLIAQYDLDLRGPYQERLPSLASTGHNGPLPGRRAGSRTGATARRGPAGPDRVYAGAILRLRSSLVAAGHDLRGVSHITGGGLPGNVSRCLPRDLAARLDPSSWPMPSVMDLFGALGGLEGDELRAMFNGGLGMVLVVAEEAVEPSIAALDEEGIRAWRVGEVLPAATVDGRRYVEESIR